MTLTRSLAVVGLGISSWLYFLKLSGKITSVVGCGGSDGCAQVLGSEWSQWFGLPVSVISALFYLGIIALTFKPSGSLLTSAAYLLIGAAIWFMGLQLFVIKSFCPWCLGTHLVGILTALAILRTTQKKIQPSLLALSAIILAGLALGQTFGPKPATHATTSGGKIAERRDIKEQNEGEGRTIEFKDESGRTTKSFRLGSVPLIGSPHAKKILVKYFDYTCSSCRDMDGDLTALLQKYPGKVAVIVLPTPLNRSCNPFLAQSVPDHKHACELARLSLAAWRAKPEVFAKVHHLLFQRPLLSPDEARQKLTTHIPAAELEIALKDPWVEASLQSDILDYQKLAIQGTRMPKLMITGDRVMQGIARTTKEFIKEMEKELQLP